METKRTMAMRWILAFVIFSGLFFSVNGLTTAPAWAKQKILIKVGVPTPLSGPAGPWGRIGVPADDTFVALFNQEGFKVGDQIYGFQLIHIDDMNTPEGGATAARKLIYEDRVKFIAGHWSWNFAAMAAITNAAKVILITRTGNEAVPGGVYDPKRMPYTVFGNPAHEQFIADCQALVKAFPKYKKIGINDSNLGKGIGWDYVDKELTRLGIRFHHEWYLPGTQDFSPYINRFAEAGCDIIYGAGDVTTAMLVAKQRYEMGYKDWHTGTVGGIFDPKAYISVTGSAAAQGFIGQYWANWEFKETQVDPKLVAMCQQVNQILTEKTGKPYTHTGWIGWTPNHLMILAQAMQKAGTVENTDAIMKAIRGGTFSTTVGTFTMSGAKTYGSPVVFGSAGAICQIQGDREVYLSESPMAPLP
ncbi:MAG: ABC transporter substrate-binding protein [Desulfobacteraceae bacterium]|nr:ABC transporter substrate-binding protein [Desulfobacteraceae bacterium]